MTMSTPLALANLTVPSAFAEALMSPMAAVLTAVTTAAAPVALLTSTD